MDKESIKLKQARKAAAEELRIKHLRKVEELVRQPLTRDTVHAQAMLNDFKQRAPKHGIFSWEVTRKGDGKEEGRSNLNLYHLQQRLATPLGSRLVRPVVEASDAPSAPSVPSECAEPSSTKHASVHFDGGDLDSDDDSFAATTAQAGPPQVPQAIATTETAIMPATSDEPHIERIYFKLARASPGDMKVMKVAPGAGRRLRGEDMVITLHKVSFTHTARISFIC